MAADQGAASGHDQTPNGQEFGLLNHEVVARFNYVCYLLEAALKQDASRRWWQSPNRLWVERTSSALFLLTDVLVLLGMRDERVDFHVR